MLLRIKIIELKLNENINNHNNDRFSTNAKISKIAEYQHNWRNFITFAKDLFIAYL